MDLLEFREFATMVIHPKYFRLEANCPMSGDIHGPRDLVAFKESPCLSFGRRRLSVVGNSWNPVIRCIGGTIISTDLAREMDAEGVIVGNGERFPLELFRIEGRAARIAPPEYCYIRPLRELDVTTEEVAVPGRAALCRRYTPRPDSAPRSDIFGIAGSNAFVCCSYRFVEIVRRMKWACFAAWPLDVPIDYNHYVDLFGKAWPPVWYPEGLVGHPNNLVSA